MPQITNITIRRAGIPDVAAISVIGKRSFAAAFGHLFSNNDELSAYLDYTYAPAKLLNSISKENNLFFLAMNNRAPVGFTKLKIQSLNKQISSLSQMELQKVYVLPEQQGSGAGSLLLKAVINLAKEKSPEYIWLDTHISNEKAILIYEKNGFKKIGKHLFTIGTQLFEYHVMALPIQEDNTTAINS